MLSGKRCRCFNNFPDDNDMVDESSCDKECSGDSSFKCGGGLQTRAMNIYMVDVEGIYRDLRFANRLLNGCNNCRLDLA